VPLPRNCWRRLTGLLFLCLPLASPAAPGGCDTPTEDCVPVGHWNFGLAVGGGVRTNPVADSDNIPLVLIPHISYYGKRVFLDNLDFGVTLAESDANTLSLLASPGYDRVFFYRSDLQNFFIEGLPTQTNYATGGQGSAGPVGPGRPLASDLPSWLG